MKSNEIVTLFLARKDAFDCVGLSYKQVAWLTDQLKRENRMPAHSSIRSNGAIPVEDKDGNRYQLVIYPNGAGFLRPHQQEVEQTRSDDEKQKLLAIAEQFRAAGNAIAADELEKAVRGG